MKKITSVDRVLYKMLLENTGKSLLDSGGIYGRSYEKNQNKTLHDFKKMPSVEVLSPKEKFEYKAGTYFDFTVSIFHYLASQLELNDICKRFNKLNNGDWNSVHDKFWGVNKKAETWLFKNHNVKFTSEVENTYNYDNNLSQNFQFVMMEIDGEAYITIQIHGGCDIREGYTTTKLFKLTSEDLNLMTNVYIDIEKKNGKKYSIMASAIGQSEFSLEERLPSHEMESVESIFIETSDKISGWLENQ